MSSAPGWRSTDRGRRLLPGVAVVALLVAVVLTVGTRHVTRPLVGTVTRHAASSDARHSDSQHLDSRHSDIRQAGAPPTFGRAEAVEYDDVGDPFVLSVPGGLPGDRTDRYVLFWTTDWRSNVPTAVSSDHVHWRRIADALPVLPTWAVPSRTMTWAPSAQRVPGGWALYFSTLDAANHDECIGSAFSTSPVGPYVDRSAMPLICQHGLGGSIDPSVVHLHAGGSALVWKSNGNANGSPVAIWEQGLTGSGLALSGARHRLVGADQHWEHGNIEGPSMLADTHGGWWLFYTGGSWVTDTYDTAVSWCATLAGPCRPTSNGPLMRGTPTAVSPAGLDTFTDGRGRLWASFSVFPGRPANAGAAMAEDRVLEVAPVLSH